MRFKTILIVVAIFLAACSPTQPTDEENGDSALLTGNVDITFPPSGSIIYAESLYLQGTAENVPAEGFKIQVIAPDDSVIAETTVQTENGQWTTEIVHDYAGDPTEATIFAKGLDDASTQDYDIETILIASADNRPDGVFGSIETPSDGETVGGDSILVIGRGSGFFENTFGLSLETRDGEQITLVGVTMLNPYFIDDVIWEAEIPRSDFVGNAVIRMTYTNMETGDEVEIDRVEIVVSSVAG